MEGTHAPVWLLYSAPVYARFQSPVYLKKSGEGTSTVNVFNSDLGNHQYQVKREGEGNGERTLADPRLYVG